jgi:hypothetical protein
VVLTAGIGFTGSVKAMATPWDVEIVSCPTATQVVAVGQATPPSPMVPDTPWALPGVTVPFVTLICSTVLPPTVTQVVAVGQVTSPPPITCAAVPGITVPFVTLIGTTTSPSQEAPPTATHVAVVGQVTPLSP